MKVLFENRITEAGRRAIGDLISRVEHELNAAIVTHGEDSPEAAQCLLELILVERIMEPCERAHARILGYLAITDQIYGPDSAEVGNALFLLGWSHIGQGRHEEGGIDTVHSFNLAKGKRDWPPVESMLESLLKLLAVLRAVANAENVQHAFVFAVHALSWLITYCPTQSPAFNVYLERLRVVIESWKFKDEVLAWLMRRCNRLNNDLTGLISVLFEEGIVPWGISEAQKSHEIDPEWGNKVKSYEIVGMNSEHWDLSEGFGKSFPVSVADGELSLRVERLLAEGCRCLSTMHGLRTVFLIFSSHGVRRRITALGTSIWSEEEKAYFQKEVRETIAVLGADSAMMLAWVDAHHRQTPESDDETSEAVMVMASDAKSYLIGLQPVRLIDGKYVFEEPMVRVDEDNWFAEFTFPVQPDEIDTIAMGTK